MIRTTGVLLGLLFCTSAWAADLPASASPSGPPVYNWTGFYAGLNAGLDQTTTHPSMTITDPNGIMGRIISLGGVAFPTSETGSGFRGGGQIGYNFQRGSWLVGIESDLTGSTTKSSQTALGLPTPFSSIIATTLEQRLDVLGTTRARAGVVYDNVLFYGTGGVAYGHVEDNLYLRETLNPAATFAATRSGYQVGWTAGGGLEFGMDRWTARFEYLYYDLGRRTLQAPASAAVLLPGALATLDQRTTGQIVRVGLNYRFGSLGLWQ
jgi:outer membrane immunogenic protein